MKISKIFKVTLVFSVIAIALFVINFAAAAYNYNDVLLKAVSWYDANRCGTDVAVNNVFAGWRGACHTSDGGDKGIDLAGGFHDGGDHVKYGLTAAFSASTMGWALYEYGPQFQSAGATAKTLQELKTFSDYFLKCWRSGSDIFYYQVGDWNIDHAYWGAPENQTSSRPSLAATSTVPASDICAQTAGALALMSLNYQGEDPTYAGRCLTAAKELYTFATTYLGRQIDNGYYNSYSFYDDLAWGAIWLSVATGDNSYLSPVDGYLEQPDLSNSNTYQKQWAYCWDDVSLGDLLMMYKLTGNQKYYNGLIWNLNWFSATLTKTPGGFPFLTNWGPLRYGAAEAGIAYLMYKNFGIATYREWANGVMDYIMGTNPKNLCYLTNYGPNSVIHPHHRANQPDQYNTATHNMLGALVGGPDSSDAFTDDVNNYLSGEVYLDYNASFILGCAGRIFPWGPTPTPIASPTPTTPAICTLSITISSLSGMPTLEVNPPGEVFRDRNKTFTYPAGTLVTIKANNYQYGDGARDVFYQWSGALSGNQNPVSFVINSNISIQANYVHGDPTPTRRITPTPTRRVTPTPTRRVTPTPTQRVTPTATVTATPTATQAPSPTVRVTPTPTPGWIPFLPTADMVTLIPAPGDSLMHVDITFPSSGYRIADPGQIAVAAGINPDGTTYLSNLTSGTRIEKFAGSDLQIITTLRITYQIHYGDTTYFAFKVLDVKVKDITVYRVPPITGTPTPTYRPITPTPTVRGGITVSYVIVSDWGTGATISVTITNNNSTAVNGWTLAWTFSGNQTITNLWNGTCTQTAANVSVKDAGHNATIPAGGGSVNFGFNMNYSGTNAKPTSATLNGMACQVQ